MKQRKLQSAAIALTAGCILVLASCTEEKKAAAPPAPTAPPPIAQSSVKTQAGVAGGVTEDVFIVSSIVTAVDAPNRRVTLTGSDGVPQSFTAGPDVRNLPQVHVGDKVSATFSRRVAIIVGDTGPAQPAAYSATGARAALGEKPGMLVAEEYEVVASVRSIDYSNRTAVLEYSDGARRTVPVRADVDLTRYKTGDTVRTRVTTALTVLVTSP